MRERRGGVGNCRLFGSRYRKNIGKSQEGDVVTKVNMEQ